MKDKEIIIVTTKEQLKELFDNWAMTWEGLREQDFQIAIQECGTEETKGYVVKGEVMNKICKLTGDNAYPKDLNIFAIYPYHGLAIQYGARWMWDIVANNAERQGYKPFPIK